MACGKGLRYTLRISRYVVYRVHDMQGICHSCRTSQSNGLSVVFG